VRNDLYYTFPLVIKNSIIVGMIKKHIFSPALQEFLANGVLTGIKFANVPIDDPPNIVKNKNNAPNDFFNAN
jgi:hypothetical protein